MALATNDRCARIVIPSHPGLGQLLAVQVHRAFFTFLAVLQQRGSGGARKQACAGWCTCACAVPHVLCCAALLSCTDSHKLLLNATSEAQNRVLISQLHH